MDKEKVQLIVDIATPLGRNRQTHLGGIGTGFIQKGQLGSCDDCLVRVVSTASIRTAGCNEPSDRESMLVEIIEGNAEDFIGKTFTFS
ncbi:MAG: hypothetical protein MJH11_20365 [Lentisphaeria bacterium]|nr:hypothetical protein [Lentisphaeria bacterium]NQY67295.1 hypothetical protein [Flavobacteriales bacterium]